MHPKGYSASDWGWDSPLIRDPKKAMNDLIDTLAYYQHGDALIPKTVKFCGKSVKIRVEDSK